MRHLVGRTHAGDIVFVQSLGSYFVSGTNITLDEAVRRAHADEEYRSDVYYVETDEDGIVQVIDPSSYTDEA